MAGVRRACNAHPTERKEDMYCGYLRGGTTFGRVLAPLRSPALDSMIGAVPATHGDPIVAHPSTSVRALGRFRGRARRADGRTGCAWTARGARCARGRLKMPDYRPAGRYFLQSPPGSMKTSSRTRRSCLSGVCLVRVFGPNTRQHRQQQQQE